MAEISELRAVLKLPLLSLRDTRELTPLSLHMQRSMHLQPTRHCRPGSSPSSIHVAFS
jgi:hypothetical protein